MSSRPKIPVDCGAWVGIPDIATGGDPPTPPSPLSKAPIFAFFRSLEWQRSPFPRNFVVRGVPPREGGEGGCRKSEILRSLAKNVTEKIIGNAHPRPACVLQVFLTDYWLF